MRISLLALLVFAVACGEPPTPPPPPPPEVAKEPAIPAFARHSAWCHGTFDSGGDGTLDFEDTSEFDVNEEVVRSTFRSFAREETSTTIHFRDADGRELDSESVVLPDRGFDARYGSSHSSYDDQGRLVQVVAGGGDGRTPVVIRTFEYDSQGRAATMIDVSFVPAAAPSKTDRFSYDDEDRIVRMERDLGSDGTVDVTFDVTYDGNTKTTTQDEPPTIVVEVDDGFGTFLSREVDRGADGQIDEWSRARLDDSGRIVGFDADTDGDGTADETSSYDYDETTKTLTVEAHDNDGVFLARNVFDYSWFPCVEPDHGACAAPYFETSIGCARWRVGPALDFGRQRHFAALAPDGTVFALGGAGGHENGVIVESAEAIDVDGDPSTEPVVRELFPHIGAGAGFARRADGRVVVVGGLLSGVLVEDTAVFDPAGLDFTTGPPLLVPRVVPLVAALDDDSVLVAGGFVNGSATRSVERLPADGTASQAQSDMPLAVTDAAILPLPGGDAVVLGGVSEVGVEDAAQVFEGSSGTWTADNHLLTPRAAFATAVLPDGRIFVVGGLGTSSFPIADVEIFDPASGGEAVAPLPRPLADAAAIVLPDGNVLVAGGRSGAERDGARPETYVYDVVADAWLEGPPLFVPRSRARAVLLEDGRVAVVGGATSDLQTTAAIEILERPL